MNKPKSQKGATLVEIIVCIAIFSMMSVSVYGLFTSIIKGIGYYREKTTVSSIADQYLEIIRNIPYGQIGTIEGNPNGPLADLANPRDITINEKPYQVYYAVSYVDDPADGTILLGTDPAPTDYKQVKLYVKNVETGVTSSFLTNASPKGLEGMANGGALYVSVFDAFGQPVPGATIHITNDILIPTVDLTRTADANGKWIEVGLPNSSNSYHVVVTKAGYSTDQTYPITVQNPDPTKPDATISNGQVTQISFSIDQLSNLIFHTLNQICAPIQGVGLAVRGTKLIGTPSVLKFDNTYSSDSNGEVPLYNIEWDSYTPALTEDTYMIYGSSPIQTASILPGTTQNFNLILGPKTPNSLLVIVKDASTTNPVEGAQVDLQSSSAPASYTIRASANGSGTISPSGSVMVDSGDDQTFTITASPGNVIQNVWVDGVSKGAVSSYTFNNVTYDHAVVANFSPAASWITGWSYRKKITISNTNVGSDLTNFPVLVKITGDSDMSSALSTGYDIRFTDSSGNNLLAYERESWSGGGGSAASGEFWVNVPTVSHSADTDIYIYYGNASATDGQNPVEVWNGNFVGVWHLSDNATNKNVIDSTGSNNGTAYANTSTKTVVGKVGNALTFNGSNDYVDLNENVGEFELPDSFTISAWANPALDLSDDIIYGNTWNNKGYRLMTTSSNKARFFLSHNTSKYKGVDSSVVTSGWHYFTGMLDDSDVKIFIDGLEDSDSYMSEGDVTSIFPSTNTKIGLDTASDAHYFKGPLDEVRVSSIALSDDWIHFEYHNMVDYGNNLTFSNQETKDVTYTITASAVAHGSITPSGSIVVNSGASQIFLITPDYGYHISEVTVDGNPQGAVTSYTFNNVSADHVIVATFSPTLIVGGYIATGFTSGSVWSQQDWSGGKDQENYVDTTRYSDDNGSINNNSIPSGLRLATVGSEYALYGTLTSSTFDTGTSSTGYTTLTWQPTSQDPATSIKFQIAANNDNLTWDFVGPDGTGSTYFDTSGTTMVGLDNNRYVRYKVFLSTTDSSKTPVLTSVNVNYVSGCAAPGQVMFPGLQSSAIYQVTVTMAGYQTQVISGLSVSGYQVLYVSLAE